VLPGLIDAHTHMYNTRPAGMSTERSMLVAIQNLQADLHAGITTARDMSSHGNGFGDVEIRNAITMGDLEGPRSRSRPRYPLGSESSEGAGESARLPDDSLRRRRARRGA
jgi:hypothetical protein